MSATAVLQAVLLAVALGVAAPPLGRYLAAVYGAGPDGHAPGDRAFAPIERVIYRVLGVDHRREQRWSAYAVSLLAFSLASMLGLYALLRLQGNLPFNPTERSGLSPQGAFNASISFVTNTNWQWFSGEVAISHLSQMLGFTVQNFVSAAVGLCVAVALIRGITRTGSRTLGSFWVDLVRGVVRVLLPLSLVAALVLVSQGVVQNLDGGTTATPIDSTTQVTEQVIPGGLVASQEAIKELGTNGGGFYNANSAHPVREPERLHRLHAGLHVAAHPVRPGGGLRTARRRQATGSAPPGGDGWHPRAVHRGCDLQRAGGQLPTGLDRRRSVDLVTAVGREHGGQGGALRGGLVWSLRGCHDWNVDRGRELHARLVHPRSVGSLRCCT